MTPEERSSGLAAAARVQRDELLALADDVLAHREAAIVAAPAPGSIMMELEHEIGRFCFAEVVVTTAEVRVDEREGWGCVMGFDREAALATAVLDAWPGSAIEALARRALEVEREARERRALTLARTRV